MILSAFPGGTGSAGVAGEGDGGELFNFPLTIDQYPPEEAIPGQREGHIWLVMSKVISKQVHNILFDGYGRTEGYPPGTLLLIVPKLGESKIYVNRGKNTGETVTPMIYQPSGESELETLWPVTLVSGNGVEVRMEISKPEGYARLITETGWENIPLYYFNGTSWEVPEAWDYLYWDTTRNPATGVDTKWQAFKLDTETFLPIRKNIPELSLSDIANTIRISNGNTEPGNCITLFPDGWAILGLSVFASAGHTQSDTAYTTPCGRRFLFDGRNPHWWFLKISKKQISYIGQMTFAPEDGRFPYQVVAITNHKIDSIRKQRNGLCVFYQYASLDKGLPTHVCFRRYKCNAARDTIEYWESNPALLNQTILDAVYLDDNSGYILTVDAMNPVASASDPNKYFRIHCFRVQGDMLVLQQTNFSTLLTVREHVNNVWGCLNMQSGLLCGIQLYAKFGGATSQNNYISAYTIDENKITFRHITSGGGVQEGPLINRDGTRFRMRIPFSSSYATKEYEFDFSTLGVTNWKEVNSWTGVVLGASPNYNRDYIFSHYMRNLPGAREDEVVWANSYIQKLDPQNPNALLDVNTFGVNSMALYSTIGGLGNLAVSTLLPDQ